MNTIAKVVDGVVVDLRVPGEFVPPEGEVWVEAPAWVRLGFRWDGSVWTKPDGSMPTDSEAQAVLSQLTLWKRLTNAERRALWTLAGTNDTALNVLGSIWSAVETESRNSDTRQLVGAALMLGAIPSLERARELLNDPGFTLA